MSLSGKRVPKAGECADYAGMICRRYYPGDSACQQFGGKQRCLLDMREAEQECPHCGGNESKCDFSYETESCSEMSRVIDKNLSR